jgi:D-arabinose 1-dehydrogenase-like Zn-dependent alcohol dehydrogenase
MRAVQVARPGGALELVEREIPTPGRGSVRVKVEACGVCHSDAGVVSGAFPFVEYPRVPGHEVAGVIDALGQGVSGWKVGQRVGIGWSGGYDGTCEHCRRGDFFACDKNSITGVTIDGGYAEYLVAPESALAKMPSDLSAIDAAPLLCAGLTTYNALRNMDLRGGDLVAVQGLGGLGHLAVQFAAKMGFRTVAIGRGADKEPLARKLGAALYIDSGATDAAKELGKKGGAKAILATAPSGKAMSELIGGLGPKGKLVVIGASSDPIQVMPLSLIGGRLSIEGWWSGTASDSEDTLAFSLLSGVRSMNEVFPLARAREAYERMMSGAARFRVVLDVTGGSR